MKLISWNVNGIRACLTKGFADFFKEVDADIFCLQETKCQQDQIDLEFEGYKSYWNSAEKKGYSGTAIFTKKPPTIILLKLYDYCWRKMLYFSYFICFITSSAKFSSFFSSPSPFSNLTKLVKLTPLEAR